jgi:hypothetical protein
LQVTRPILLVALLIALGVLASPGTAEACSCSQQGPACQAFWKTDAVFDAIAESIEPTARPERDGGGRMVSPREKLVRMTVRHGYKGVTAAGPVEVVTAEHEAGCGYDFKPGRRYLVFAQRRPADGKWITSICSSTQEYDGSGPSGTFLASLTMPAAGGRVFGSVKTRDRSFDYQHSSRDRDVSARVGLVGAGREQSTTSTDGSYEFRGVEPGRYVVEVDPPQGYSPEYLPGSRNVEIPDPRACHEETFYLAPAGRITGVVVTADGRPAGPLQVELTPPGTPEHPVYGLATISAYTKSDGTFEITGVPPGRYILGVNLKDLPSQYNPYARTVFPSDGSGDAILQVGTTGTYDIGTWKLPRALPVVTVRGVATWADGTAAAGTHVTIWDVTGNPVDRARGAGMAKVAADGAFVLEVRVGRSYTFTARDSTNAVAKVIGPRLDVAAAPVGPIRLVLQRPDPPK